MACPYCRSTQTRLDRSLGGREICAGCGLPTAASRSSSWRRSKLFHRPAREDQQGRYLVSRPIGAAIAAVIVVAGSVFPSLAPLDARSFVAIANHDLPLGYRQGAFGELTKEPVFQAILRNGGQIVLATTLNRSRFLPDVKGPGEIVGLWDPSTGTMRLKAGELERYDYQSVLKHEAIHMAQSCHANSIKAAPVPIGLPITQAGLERMEPFRTSDPDYYADPIEREAFANADRSSNDIASLIDRECGSRPWIPALGRLRSSLQSLFLH
jgi:hypothetical protein